MIIPTWNGSPVFGIAVEMVSYLTPNAIQVNEFPGLDGNEVLNLGARGQIIEGKCLLSGFDEGDLLSQRLWFKNVQARMTRGVLVDTQGEEYPYAILLEFRPTEKLHADPTMDAPAGVSQEHAFRFFQIL